MQIMDLRYEVEECLHIGFCQCFYNELNCIKCFIEKNCLQQYLIDKADALDIIKKCMKGF
jgi:hypothetical protein